MGLVLLVVVIALAGVVTYFSTRDSEDGIDIARSADPDRDGERACARFQSFVDLVAANADADAVEAELDEVVRLSISAAKADPAYVPLASGTQAVRSSLRSDSAPDARVGVDVVRANCDRLFPDA